MSAFVHAKLADEIKRLHNPTSEKTIQLFRDYAGVDLTESWQWNNSTPQLARERLNGYMKLRGDVVHRTRVIAWPSEITPSDDLLLARFPRFFLLRLSRFLESLRHRCAPLARLAHLLAAAVGDELLLGVDVGVVAGLLYRRGIPRLCMQRNPNWV